MNSKKYFLKNSSIYFLGNAVNAAVPLALLPFLTRYLAPAEYGIVAMFQTVLGLSSAFVGLSTSTTATRKFYDNSPTSEYADFMGSCVHVIFLSALLSCGIVILLNDFFNKFFGLNQLLIFGAVLLSALNAAIQLRLAQWQIRNKASSFFYLLLFQGLANFTISFVFITFLALEANGRILGQVLVGLIFGFFSLYFLKKDGLINFKKLNARNIKEIFIFGFPLIPHMSSAFLLGAVDRVIVNRELGAQEVGIYAVAVQFAAVLGIFFDSVNKAFIPWLFEKLNRNIINELNEIIRWTYLSMFFLSLLAVISFFISPMIIFLVAGEKYSRASEVIGFLVISQIFSGMYYLVTNYIFYSKKTIILSYLSIFSGLLNLGLLLMIVPLYGIKGAAVSCAISAFVQFVLTWLAAYKLHPMPWFSKDIFAFERFKKN